MYIPDQFKMDTAEAGLALAERYPFATLVTRDLHSLHIDHVPLLVSRQSGGQPILAGHLGAKNPHVAALAAVGETFAIFHGPHAYVSPRWYASYDVPTWNYAVLHVRGKVRMIEGDAPLLALLGRMTARFEQPLGGLAGPLVPADLRGEGEIAAAIAGFEVYDLELTGKLKLNQNRSLEDQRGAAAGLERQSDEGSRAVAALMRSVMRSGDHKAP